MKRQDPTFRAGENEETGQTLISGMGELHLEVIKHRLLRDFNLNVRVHKPRVSYKETVAAAAEALGKCNRQIGGQTLVCRSQGAHRAEGRQQTGPRVHELVQRSGSGAQCDCRARRGAEGACRRGAGLLGCPLWNCSLELLEHPLPEPIPTEVPLRIAAADAFTRVLEAAGVVLLEPIMAVEVTTPDEHLGDVINDLQQRRAIITSTQNRGAITIVDAEAPLAAMFGYSMAVRSLSQGRASFSMEPLKYGPAPPEVREGFL